MDTLYEQIGGEQTIQLLVSTFYEHVLSDPVLSPFFENVPIDRLQTMQLEFFGIALGRNEGAARFDLYAKHRHLNLKVEHLTRFTDHLLTTLKEIGIEEKKCRKVHERIASYSNDLLGNSTEDG